MLNHHSQEVESEIDDLIGSEKTLLLSEARAMALLVMDTYFPSIDDLDDITCLNCQSFINCGGKRLDFNGVIECMVNKAIHGTDNPDQLGSLIPN
jgi:hypothetical protein